jgi:dihydrofolate synthase / folylpolyglutamate synthase
LSLHDPRERAPERARSRPDIAQASPEGDRRGSEIARDRGRGEAHAPSAPARWSEARAERQLGSLELFGMRFGLQRMRALMDELGSPEQAFDSIHVLGTNGKSSTTRLIAAILARHGLRTASYTSPHLVGFRERVEICEREIAPAAFAGAVQRAAAAAARVERGLAADDRVTQFEELTAGAFSAIAQADVSVAVIEAGLGGRYDATSVIEPAVTVLTNVALEHTRWLGSSIAEIALEKVAALPQGGVLALGAGLAGEARAVAEQVASERGARIVHADLERPIGRLVARGAFQRANFALARTAAEAYLELVRPNALGTREHERALSRAARETEIPGRFQVIAEDPLTILDGAHNPAAVAALIGSLPDLVGERPLSLVFGVLEDKDAATMLARLLPICERAWLTEPRSERARSVEALGEIARGAGFAFPTCEPDAGRALLAAQGHARERGGAVLVTGSVYLVGEVLALERSHARPRAHRQAAEGSVRR